VSVITDIIKGVISPITGLIDELHTSDEEKLNAKAKLVALTNDLHLKLIEYETVKIQEQAKVIAAEASSNWYVASWRPTLMYCFILIFLYSIPAAVFGWPAVDFSGIPDKAWTMLTLGITGYVGARTIDKTLVPAVKAFKGKEEA